MVATKKDKLTGDSLGTGRRKTAVARVRVRSGSGKVTINGREFEHYFPDETQRNWILDVLKSVNRQTSVDLLVRVSGGGPNGQAGAIRMGLARALMGYDDALFPTLRDNGYLTRDSRMKERKKYGLHGLAAARSSRSGNGESVVGHFIWSRNVWHGLLPKPPSTRIEHRRRQAV